MTVDNGPISPFNSVQNAPGTIAASVYSGHGYARALDASKSNDPVPFRRELPAISMTVYPLSGPMAVS